MVVASPALALERSEDLQRVTLFHVEHRQVPADSPTGKLAAALWAGRVERGSRADLQRRDACAAGGGGGPVVIASRLLARDLLQRGVLAAPFEMALPGANYYR